MQLGPVGAGVQVALREHAGSPRPSLGVAEGVGPVEGAGLRDPSSPYHGVHRGVPGYTHTQPLKLGEVSLTVT